MLADAPARMSTPGPMFGSESTPVTSVPIMFPRIALLVVEYVNEVLVPRSIPAKLLPEIRLPAAVPIPPIVLSGRAVEEVNTGAEIWQRDVPVTSVPIMLPATTIARGVVAVDVDAVARVARDQVAGAGRRSRRSCWPAPPRRWRRRRPGSAAAECR